MTASVLHVVARFRARPDAVDRVRAILLGFLEPTRTERGCIRYELLHDREDPARFTFVEEWTDEQALADHLASPHIRDALPELESLCAEPPEVRRLVAVEAEEAGES